MSDRVTAEEREQFARWLNLQAGEASFNIAAQHILLCHDTLTALEKENAELKDQWTKTNDEYERVSKALSRCLPNTKATTVEVVACYEESITTLEAENESYLKVGKATVHLIEERDVEIRQLKAENATLKKTDVLHWKTRRILLKRVEVLETQLSVKTKTVSSNPPIDHDADVTTGTNTP